MIPLRRPEMIGAVLPVRATPAVVAEAQARLFKAFDAHVRSLGLRVKPADEADPAGPVHITTREGSLLVAMPRQAWDVIISRPSLEQRIQALTLALKPGPKPWEAKPAGNRHGRRKAATLKRRKAKGK